MSEEKFCLKWNDFESSLSRSFKELRGEADLIDVWLCSEAGEREEAVPVAAHRLVLSACSGVLRRLLRRKGPGPSLAPGVVYLRGVASQDLQNIVSFMYDGEVSIAQDQLNSFLAAAEDLQVKGLTQDKSKSSQSPPKKASTLIPKKATSLLTPRPVSQFASNDDDIEEIAAPIKNELFSGPSPASSHQTRLGGATESQLVDYEDPGDGAVELADMGDMAGYGEDENFVDTGFQPEGAQGHKVFLKHEQLDSYISSVCHQLENKTYLCGVCDKPSEQRQVVERHIESCHIVTVPFACDLCGASLKTRHGFKRHMRSHKNLNINIS